MADDLGLYWSLFQGEFPDEWRSDPDFALYLSELSSFSVEKLQFEPEHLTEERRCVLNSTQKMAFNNYQTFIETAECTRVVFKDFVAVENHVSQLLEKMPNFVTACKKFAKESQDINTDRKLNSLALSKHTQLLEILEIPQVMETCVRNGYYEEALDLNAHVKRMYKKHGGIPIIKTIADDVQSSMELMLNQLLQQLRSVIQLPACLRVVGFLKRMEVYSDTELRLKFLQTRDTWLQNMLSSIPSEDPYHHISKTIEASRVHLFDIVTQYRAIFPDDDAVKMAYSSQAAGDDYVKGALFYTWVNAKIWQFLKILEDDLQRGVGGRMDSLLGQCMYFGLSFSRIGADFRSLITPVFVRVLVNSFRQTLRTAKHQFHSSMKHFTLSTPIRSLATLSTHPSFATPSSSPPHTLLDYSPLATLMNSVIVAFNELRQCAPLSLGPEVAQEMRRLLESTVHDVAEYYRVEHGSFTEKETETFQQLVRVVVRDFLPYLKHIFESLFSESAVEQLALMSPYALHHCTPLVGGSTSAVLSRSRAGIKLRMELNIESIAEPLKTVAPEVFEELEALKRKQFVEQHQIGLAELSTDNVAMDTETIEDHPATSEVTEQNETTSTADDGHQKSGLALPLTVQTLTAAGNENEGGQLSSEMLVESNHGRSSDQLNSAAVELVKDKTA